MDRTPSPSGGPKVGNAFCFETAAFDLQSSVSPRQNWSCASRSHQAWSSHFRRSRMCHSGLHGYSNFFRFCVDIRSYHDNCFLLFPPSRPLHIFMHSCASCSVVAVINALRIDCISGSESVHFACQFRRCFLTDARKRYHGRDKDRNYNLMEKVGTWENMGSHSDHSN